MNIKQQANDAQQELETLSVNGRVYYIHSENKDYTAAAIIAHDDDYKPIVLIGMALVNPKDNFSRSKGRLIASRRILSILDPDGRQSFYSMTFGVNYNADLRALIPRVINKEEDSNKELINWLRNVINAAVYI